MRGAGGCPSFSEGALAKGGLSVSRRDQDAEESELGSDQEGRLVPLRPVSELGLVDITDVPARDTRTATRSRSTRGRSHPPQPLRSNSANDRQVEAEVDRPQGARASTQREPDAGRRASKSRAGSTSKRGSKATATAEDSGDKSNRARSSTATKPGTTSERRSTRKPR